MIKVDRAFTLGRFPLRAVGRAIVAVPLLRADQYEASNATVLRLSRLQREQPACRTFFPAKACACYQRLARLSGGACVLGALVATCMMGPLGLILLVPAAACYGVDWLLKLMEKNIFKRALAPVVGPRIDATERQRVGMQMAAMNPACRAPAVSVLQFGEPTGGPETASAAAHVFREVAEDVVCQVRESVAALVCKNDALQVRAALQRAFDVSWFDKIETSACKTKALRLHILAATLVGRWVYFANNGACSAWLIDASGTTRVSLPRSCTDALPVVSRVSWERMKNGLLVLGPCDIKDDWSREDQKRWLSRLGIKGGAQETAQEILETSNAGLSESGCMVIDGKMLDECQPATWLHDVLAAESVLPRTDWAASVQKKCKKDVTL